MEWNVLKIQQNNTDVMFRKQKENKIEGCTKYIDIKVETG